MPTDPLQNTTIPALQLADLTQITVEGMGAFDVLMRANKAHLEQEFNKGRIKGAEYATVYLGSLQPVLQAALGFLLQKDKTALEAQLIQQQILLAEAQVAKMTLEGQLVTAEIAKANASVLLVQAEVLKANAEKDRILAEITKLGKDSALIQAQAELAAQQKLNLAAEALNIPKQGALIDSNKAKVDSENLLVIQQKANLTAQALNIPKEGLVLDGTKCKLDAEYTLLTATITKTATENSLITQKIASEKAQISNTGVEADSVIGKQKALYQAQSDGFKRDAEQKAAKVMVDSWNVRRTTDDTTAATTTNKLDDASVGTVVGKLISGIGA